MCQQNYNVTWRLIHARITWTLLHWTFVELKSEKSLSKCLTRALPLSPAVKSLIMALHCCSDCIYWNMLSNWHCSNNHLTNMFNITLQIGCQFLLKEVMFGVSWTWWCFSVVYHHWNSRQTSHSGIRPPQCHFNKPSRILLSSTAELLPFTGARSCWKPNNFIPFTGLFTLSPEPRWAQVQTDIVENCPCEDSRASRKILGFLSKYFPPNDNICIESVLITSSKLFQSWMIYLSHSNVWGGH